MYAQLVTGALLCCNKKNCKLVQQQTPREVEVLITFKSVEIFDTVDCINVFLHNWRCLSNTGTHFYRAA